MWCFYPSLSTTKCTWLLDWARLVISKHFPSQVSGHQFFEVPKNSVESHLWYSDPCKSSLLLPVKLSLQGYLIPWKGLIWTPVDLKIILFPENMSWITLEHGWVGAAAWHMGRAVTGALWEGLSLERCGAQPSIVLFQISLAQLSTPFKYII